MTPVLVEAGSSSKNVMEKTSKNNSKDLYQDLKDLNLPKGKYVLFGSAPMSIRGLKKEFHDLDIVVTQDVWDKHRNKKGWKLVHLDNGSDFLWNNDLELYYDWKPGDWDAEDLISRAEIIDDLPFVTLEDCLKWKKLSGREKDLKDAELIEYHLLKA